MGQEGTLLLHATHQQVFLYSRSIKVQLSLTDWWPYTARWQKLRADELHCQHHWNGSRLGTHLTPQNTSTVTADMLEILSITISNVHFSNLLNRLNGPQIQLLSSPLSAACQTNFPSFVFCPDFKEQVTA